MDAPTSQQVKQARQEQLQMLGFVEHLRGNAVPVAEIAKKASLYTAQIPKRTSKYIKLASAILGRSLHA